MSAGVRVLMRKMATTLFPCIELNKSEGGWEIIGSTAGEGGFQADRGPVHCMKVRQA